MSFDAFVGIAANIVCTFFVVLLTPGFTVMIDRMMRLKESRFRLVRVLNECERCLGSWIRSSTSRQWERGREEIDDLYHELGRIKESFPFIGGGHARVSEITGEGHVIGNVQSNLALMLMYSRGTGPTEEQKQARAENFKYFCKLSSEVKRIVDGVEHFPEFRTYLLKEILEVYGSMWSVISGVMRRHFQN